MILNTPYAEAALASESSDRSELRASARQALASYGRCCSHLISFLKAMRDCGREPSMKFLVHALDDLAGLFDGLPGWREASDEDTAFTIRMHAIHSRYGAIVRSLDEHFGPSLRYARRYRDGDFDE